MEFLQHSRPPTVRCSPSILHTQTSHPRLSMTATRQSAPNVGLGQRPPHPRRASTSVTTISRCRRRSSAAANSPTAEESLALYYRSVELFRPAASVYSIPRPSTSYVRRKSSARHDSAISYTELAATVCSAPTSIPASPPISPTCVTSLAFPLVPDQTDEPDDEPVEPLPQTVIDWTTPETRQREHAAIDRRQKGLRQVLRRLTPKCFRRRRDRSGFYGEEGWESGDDCSVRRYRVGARA